MSQFHINALYQTLANMVEVFHRHGVANVVLCPGSRSAPLAISILRSEKFDCFHLVDERSAGYFALGLAKASGRPTVIVCTSGTAVYNFAPAVAEAYFQEIPLIVCTADRPEESIGQNDNQAIFQENIFGKHVLSFAQMPTVFNNKNDARWAIQKVNEACNAAYAERQGPVHLNFPFREPFYPDKDFLVAPDFDLKLIGVERGQSKTSELFLNDVKAVIEQSQNIWLVAGMMGDIPNDYLINEFIEKTGAIPFIDPLCNLHVKGQLYQYDSWLKNEEIESPDLLISFGNHFLSKSLKELIRENPPQNHLHIQEHGQLADPFKSINFLVKAHVDDFFGQLNEYSFEVNAHSNRFSLLDKEYSLKANVDTEYLWAKRIIAALPNQSVLHLGNSTPVRYLLKYNNLLKSKSITVYANRGTSGIDGCVSTAIGMAQNDDRTHYLIIGDLSAYYDRNGLWHKYVPSNFKMIVMNNRGGGIFNRINGPKAQQELQEYFVNTQPTDFEALANAHAFSYQLLEKDGDLNEQLICDGKVIYEVKM
ncbi:MAG: 2-succinyl-5-enolpyruvyl-6-hydroxy-3-cyclohexene-1-carboxylic-acid synthase [Bacteroidia bacterium]